jgi:hypothetical protein
MSKSLEERYRDAGPDTYVGKVRTLQSAASTNPQGVNFLDGTPRSQNNSAPDEYQDEFTRNKPGSFKYGGEGKVPGSLNTTAYPLSRWLSKGLEKAFGAEGYYTNNRYTTISNVRNAPNTRVHNYAPLSGKRYDDVDIVSARVNGGAKGPAPSGLGG